MISFNYQRRTLSESKQLSNVRERKTCFEDQTSKAKSGVVGRVYRGIRRRLLAVNQPRLLSTGTIVALFWERKRPFTKETWSPFLPKYWRWIEIRCSTQVRYGRKIGLEISPSALRVKMNQGECQCLSRSYWWYASRVDMPVGGVRFFIESDL